MIRLKKYRVASMPLDKGLQCYLKKFVIKPCKEVQWACKASIQ